MGRFADREILTVEISFPDKFTDKETLSHDEDVTNYQEKFADEEKLDKWESQVVFEEETLTYDEENCWRILVKEFNFSKVERKSKDLKKCNPFSTIKNSNVSNASWGYHLSSCYYSIVKRFTIVCIFNSEKFLSHIW